VTSLEVKLGQKLGGFEEGHGRTLPEMEMTLKQDSLISSSLRQMKATQKAKGKTRAIVITHTKSGT
jgi:hypothetical protein